MNNQVHLYRARHIFIGDDTVGKYNAVTKTIHLFQGMEAHGPAIVAWFKRVQKIWPRGVAGPETLETISPPIQLPEKVLALMTPEQGERTPAVVQWCRNNLPEDDFSRRYGPETPYVVEKEAIGVPDSIVLLDEHDLTPPNPAVTADALGGSFDDGDSVPQLTAEGAADFPQGGPDADDDDFADTDPLAGILVNPALNEGVVKEEVAAPTLEVVADSEEVKAPIVEVPAVIQEGKGPIYTLKGAEILHDGQVIAELYGDEKQLRMRANQSPHKAAVRDFLDAQFLPPTP